MSSAEVNADEEEWLYELSELPGLLTVCLRSCEKASDFTFLQRLKEYPAWPSEIKPKECTDNVLGP